MGASAPDLNAPPEEVIALLSDQQWRLNNLYKVVNEHGRLVTFQPNWAQLELFSTLGHKNLDLKVRQIGITTGYCILWLDTALFSPNISIGIVAHTKDAAKVIMRDKVKYAYDNLPEEIKQQNPLVVDNAEELVFKNGSKIRVSVSFMSGTVQILHVTEFGYICQYFPSRAQEVTSGSMQAVHDDGIIVIESTARGRAGRFFDMATEAQKPHSEWTFRFLPWYKEPEYRKVVERPIEYKAETDYLDEIQKKLNIVLDKGQRQWWCSKRRELGEDVFSEFPSTPEEAFKVTTQGAYYGQQMMEAARTGRITRVPVDRALRVDTWWDLGINDSMVIWFIQRYGYEIRAVDYYENTGEGLPHYARYLDEWAQKNNAMFGTHIAPHDIKVRELGTGQSRFEVSQALGINFTIAPSLPVIDGIERVRSILPRVVFDEEKCSRGIECLEHYRKEWDPVRGIYKSQPLHDWASHGSDAFRTGAVGMEVTQQIVHRRHARPVVKENWR